MNRIVVVFRIGALAVVLAFLLAGCDLIFGSTDGGPTTVTSELSGSYDDLTLEAGNLYRVTADVAIAGTLTIEEGVFMEFGSDTWLYIRDDALIKAVGTEDDPIVMRGSTKTPGFWQGVYIRSSNVTNTLEHVTIQHTGSSEIDGDKAAIVLEGF